MILRRLNLLPTSESHLAWARITGSTSSMQDWRATTAIITCVSRILWLQYNLRLQQQGQKIVWQAWQVYIEIAETFVYLAGHPFQLLDIDDDHFQKLERLTVILCAKPVLWALSMRQEGNFSSQKSSNEQTATHQGWSAAACPTRSVSSRNFTSAQAQLVNPFPRHFAWTKVSQSWVPVWLTIAEVSTSCRGLIKCSCKRDYSNCSCSKAHLDCAPLCKCNCTT